MQLCNKVRVYFDIQASQGHSELTEIIDKLIRK